MKDTSPLEDSIHPVVKYISKYIGNISKDELEFILQLVHFSSYSKGSLIYKQGVRPTTACFLMKGAVRSFYTDEEGKDNTVGFSFENTPVIPYGSFIEQVPSGVSIVALEPVEMLWTSRQEYLGFLEKHSRFETGIAKLLGEYLVKGGDQLKLIRISSSRERYERLCELQPEVIKRVPLKYIASYLGMALETLSRVRAGKL